MKQKGFTLIELLIIVAMLGVIGAILIRGLSILDTGASGSSSFSFGLNGVTETRCINGYMFNVGSNGSTQQILNEKGGGIRCGR